MTYVTNFARFWYDFVIGDDWTIAAAVTVTLAVLIVLVHAHVKLWWLLPVVVVLGLGASVWRAARAE
ncbi:MAG: hypothetical protein NVS2B16_31110 [Chloroflexota bacterium]